MIHYLVSDVFYGVHSGIKQPSMDLDKALFMEFVKTGEYSLGFKQKLDRIEGSPQWRITSQDQINNFIEVLQKAQKFE